MKTTNVRDNRIKILKDKNEILKDKNESLQRTVDSFAAFLKSDESLIIRYQDFIFEKFNYEKEQ